MLPGKPGPWPDEPAFARSGVDDLDDPDGAARTVLIHDPRTQSTDAVDEIVAACGLRARRVPEAAALARLRPNGDTGIAMVASSGEAGAAAPMQEAVGILKKKGYTVLCYWSSAGRWALGAQCRLLLAGASNVLDSTDPAFARDLREQLLRLLEARTESQREEQRTRAQMTSLGVVGSGPAITGVYRWVQRVSALSDLPVLIGGETGTGKEMVARAVHRLDPRRSAGPFVPVNCSAISTGLAESELFGHRRGAFTGAQQDRKGFVRAASGGVLFLDEIGDLDLALQGKLLRVLQERRVLAVGHDEEEPVDVRVIAATHRDLADLVRRQLFRADLLHRLNVLSVRVPALRERPEDVEPLVRHFMARAADVPPSAVVASRDLVRALRRVELPGNVRQLENVVRRAMVTWRRGDTLSVCDLPPELWIEIAHVADQPAEVAPEPNPDEVAADDRSPAAAPALVDAVGVLEAASWQLDRALALCEQTIVSAALGVSRGNRSRAARLLGISPRSIFNKLRKYHI
jgi:DNA-binding NtrC family response regulator